MVNKNKDVILDFVTNEFKGYRDTSRNTRIGDVIALKDEKYVVKGVMYDTKGICNILVDRFHHRSDDLGFTVSY